MQDQVSDAVIASDKWTAYGEGLELRPRKAGTGTGPVVDGLELILVCWCGMWKEGEHGLGLRSGVHRCAFLSQFIQKRGL